MRIAIVGAGVSGLVAAHLLHDRHDITVFEAGAYVGGHTNTIRVDTDTATHDVDTGFIVFNDRNYPNFTRLLERLGVATQPSSMSFSVKAEDEDFEYGGHGPNALFAQRSNLTRPAFLRMLRDFARFNRHAAELLASERPGPSLGEFLESNRYSHEFIDRLIVPQAAAVWSADPRQMWSFPARFLAEFFHNHGMLSVRGRPRWFTVAGGSRRYAEALIRPFADRIHLRAPVRRIERDAAGVEVTVQGAAAQRFDEVVVAAHADQALAMLADPSDSEGDALAAIPYQRNEAVLHTDRRLLPRRRRAWASWNYHLLSEPTGRSTVTYHMNRLQALTADREFCVTLNRTDAIDPAKIIRRISYAHPVFTQAGVEAQRLHAQVSGSDRVHFCGAYWGWGFHEDGVVSALRACERLGARLEP